MPSTKSEASEAPIGATVVTRREVVAALGGASVLASTTQAEADSDDTADEVDSSPVHVRVYPGPMPTSAWARYRWHGIRRGWAPPFEDALEAVRDAFDQVEQYATAQNRLTDLEITVERGAPVDVVLSRSSRSSPQEAIAPSQQQVLDAFRDVLRQRDLLLGHCCHLLLWWGPFDYAVGYGGVRRPNRHVAFLHLEGSQTVANLGATEVWDTRDVTKNIAIHEAFHTFLSPSVVEDVIDSRCDHDLGSARRVDENTLEVSPMATAYAGPNRVGGGTRWHGTACYDHDAFYRHDGYDGIENWQYTTELSEATLEATTTYIERNLY